MSNYIFYGLIYRIENLVRDNVPEKDVIFNFNGPTEAA